MIHPARAFAAGVALATLLAAQPLPAPDGNEAPKDAPETIMPHETMTRDGMPRDEMSRDGMSRATMGRDGMSRDTLDRLPAMEKPSLAPPSLDDPGAPASSLTISQPARRP